MARNPAVMQEMMRNQDRALSNLEVTTVFANLCGMFKATENAVVMAFSPCPLNTLR